MPSRSTRRLHTKVEEHWDDMARYCFFRGSHLSGSQFARSESLLYQARGADDEVCMREGVGPYRM